MSHGYVPVQWNRSKVIYDLLLWAAIVTYLGAFVAVTLLALPAGESLSPMIMIIRALASCAFVMLTLILCIGPLARLSPRFLPLLYNRRHFGVSMFVIAFVHAVLAVLWYHAFGPENPILSIFTSPGSFSTLGDFPFQPFGAVALVILLLLAATSHDFWNTNLGAGFWKALHMLVYLAYGLLIVHVATGAMQEHNTGFSAPMLYGSVALVGVLHLAAFLKSSRAAVQGSRADWVTVRAWHAIPDNAAVVVHLPGDERVAVFRYDERKLAAVSNVCKHQAGPLGEGRVIDGCITCPWHGFQYRPEDGRSPPPFTEKLATYELRLDGEMVLLNSTALPEGTARPVLEVPA